MKNKYCLLWFTMITFNLFAVNYQTDTVFNQTDGNGLKQGYWKKYYPNGHLMYKGFFKDNKPAGEMLRYFESGHIKALMQFNEKGDYATAKLYYEDGTLASEGFYSNAKKDSIWNYFSYYDKKLVSSETYKNGIKQGYQYHYYPDGNCFEKTMWKNNLKDGDWEQFFEDGTLRLKAAYMKGKLSGDFIAYHPKNVPMVKGRYTNDIREGKWIYYNENGSVSHEILYVNGQAQNEKELTEQQQQYFKKIEENIGKFTEPDPNEFFQRNKYNGDEY